MTFTKIIVLHCNAPGCTTKIQTDTLPEGWRRLWSTAHIPPPQPPTWGRQPKALSHGERSHGQFVLDLCPAHLDAFTVHLPMTDSTPSTRGLGQMVTVSCGCGERLGWIPPTYDGDPADGPVGAAQRLWWAHLPDDLRAYYIPPTPTPNETKETSWPRS